MTNPTAEACKKSVERIQNFDAKTLVRREDLGQLSFINAVEPAQKLIDFFNLIPTDFLDEVPDNILGQIKSHADSVFNTFGSILNFSALQNSAGERDNLIEVLKNNFEPIFNGLHNVVSYLTSRKRDFGALEREARAATQAAKDAADELKGELNKSVEDAQRIMDNIRKTASEQGVSQKAIYFKDESDIHAKEADKWRKYTVRTAIGLGAFAAFSIFLHKIPFFAPTNTYDSIQLTASKALVAASIGYMLILCARNFMSHKHNEILNKHRQNALLTFNALVDATKDESKRDIILQSAASCIFSPQDTGYNKHGSSGDSGTVKFVEIAPKMSGSGS